MSSTTMIATFWEFAKVEKSMYKCGIEFQFSNFTQIPILQNSVTCRTSLSMSIRVYLSILPDLKIGRLFYFYILSYQKYMCV
jgi:hypothetical protein